MDSTLDSPGAKPLSFGSGVLQHFDLDPNTHNLNHASFGATPSVIRKKMRQYADDGEARPDAFHRYERPAILDASREAAAALLKVPTDTVVFVPNATTGVDTVMHNMVWHEDGRDEILYFSTIYGACGKIVDCAVDTGLGRVSSRGIDLIYPCEDEEIITAFKAAIKTSSDIGRRPKICLYDTVSSLPGVRFPFEEVTRICKDEGILSLVDGAQGIGLIDLDIGTLDPDFFVTNCHKWLHVPRTCAAFYVPFRNQAMVRSTLPVSHGYQPQVGAKARFNPLPTSRKPVFVNNFEWTGTLDTSPWLCVKYAIRWREEMLGGETRIMSYMQDLARQGGKRVAEILGTEVLDNKAQTMSRCAMTNVALPLSASDGTAASAWMLERLVLDYNTFIPFSTVQGRLWARLSAQVYLQIEDFEWAGRTLLDLCNRVEGGEHLKS
ncbi:pyridoxal phosphate-dependent transferase [Xylariomycetidae sp. FL0641]|nr:pyridoxal phosphate-dependent transferase [Xylariomycetidae sp. FL0641]